jgi:nitrite reductase/ring-hydroxylating ferredoxin subunit
MALTRPPKPVVEFLGPGEESNRIPKEGYLSREFLEWESEKLWPYVWQIACREEELPKVGDYLEYTIVDQSILIVRVASGAIKAFYNSCRHRGTQLKHGYGSAMELRCRYHAWRWNLDGSIKEVTHAEDFDPECIASDCLQLPECLVDTWGGFVFLNMDRNAPPLQEFLRPIPENLAHLEVDKMRFARYQTFVIAANWKTTVDAFQETYHILGVHPQVLLWFDPAACEYEQYGIHSHIRLPPVGVPSRSLGSYKPSPREVLRTAFDDMGSIGMTTREELASLEQMIEGMDIPDDMPLLPFFANLRRMLAAAEGLDFWNVSDIELLTGPYWNIFPNIIGPVNVGNWGLLRVRPNGMDPESCLLDFWSLQRFAEGRAPARVEREFYEDWTQCEDVDRVTKQDLANIPNVQRGMHSRGFSHLICGREDANVRNHHRAVMSYLTRGEDGWRWEEQT